MRNVDSLDSVCFYYLSTDYTDYTDYTHLHLMLWHNLQIHHHPGHDVCCNGNFEFLINLYNLCNLWIDGLSTNYTD